MNYFMKRFTLFMLSLMVFTGVYAQTYIQPADSYAGGSGTKADPYQIATIGQLAKLANDVNTTANISRGKYYVLTQDITVNANLLANDDATLESQSSFALFRPIGTFSGYDSYQPFQGKFDGQGHTISGLFMTTFEGNTALFRVAEGATIKNLNIADTYIYGGKYCAGIVSVLNKSKVVNCSFQGKIKSWEWYTAGIAGQVLWSSEVRNCYADAILDGKAYSGGLVGIIGKEASDGASYNSTVEGGFGYCQFKHTVAGADASKDGGIVAWIRNGATALNAFFRPMTSKAVGTNDGTMRNLKRLRQSKNFLDKSTLDSLNHWAEHIPGACRWVTGTSYPKFDFTTTTPEEEEADINTIATDPSPADDDTHAPSENGKVTLGWTLPADGLTVSQQLYFGTDSVAVATGTNANVTLAKENTYTIDINDYTSTYFWRVDCTNGNGETSHGTVWSFSPARLAFPGAEGYGRFARGGRGGNVVYVTNLKDYNPNSENADSAAVIPGSLRWALTNHSGPRTVVFKVGGVIDMGLNPVFIDDDVTIAGQTAPGKGICIYHSDLAIGNDNICRFIRARRGAGATGNAMGVAGKSHSIIDHTTLSWGTDETFSSRSAKNITFQRSIISEALGIANHKNYPAGTNHGYAATIGGDIGSFHHNLLADCEGRNWSMGGGTDASGAYAGRLDIFNNVVYNWHNRTTDGGAHEINFVNNYYKVGAANNHNMLFSLQLEGNLPGTQSAYVSGNIRDNANGSLTQDKQGDTYEFQICDGRSLSDVNWQYFVNEPFFPSYATIEPAKLAYKTTLSDIGANQPEVDNTDSRIVGETLNRTYTYTGSRSGIKGEIDNESDADGLEVYETTAQADDYDADLDGIPAWYETLIGTSDNEPTNNNDTNGDGYSDLEDYLNFMAQEHRIMKPGESADIDLQSLFRGFTKSPSYSYSYTGSALTLTQNGSKLTVKASANGGSLNNIALTVTDGDGDTMTRQLNIAVTGDPTAISSLRSDYSAEVKSYAVYTTDGRLIAKGGRLSGGVNSLQLPDQHSGLYILNAVYSDGTEHSFKVLKK